MQSHNYFMTAIDEVAVKRIASEVIKITGQQAAFIDQQPSTTAGQDDPRIDIYNKLLKDGLPTKALNGLLSILDDSQHALRDVERFRIKANIGQCHWRLGNLSAAANWFDEASEEIPGDSKAIAYEVLTLILREKAAEAFQKAKRQLKRYPDNEWLAVYLIYAAMSLPDAQDPLALIPSQLLTQSMVVATWRILFLRNLSRQPDWWNAAIDAVQRFPEDRLISLFAAEANVDEIAQRQALPGRHILAREDIVKLEAALVVFKEFWDIAKIAENPNSDDGLSALNSSMVTCRLLGKKTECISFIREIVNRTNSEELLINTIQCAMALDEKELAEACLTKLPTTGRAKFQRAMYELNHGDWVTAAELLSDAEIPDSEKRIVEAIIELAPFNASGKPVVEEEFAGFIKKYNDPRALIMFAQLAMRLKLINFANDAFEKALNSIGKDASMAARQMVADFARRTGNARAIIKVFDGHIDTKSYSTDLQWLADAHASEFPHRDRNRNFFERLSSDLLDDVHIARAYGSVLLDTGSARDAEKVLRRVVEESPSDIVAHLRLLDAFRCQKNLSDVVDFVKSIDEYQFLDVPELAIRWAIELREAGEPERALKLAYDLVQRNQMNSGVALGYVGLVLGNERFPLPNPKTVSPDVFVWLESSSGDNQRFIIDGASNYILGVECLPSSSERVSRLLYLSVGDSIQVDSVIGQLRTWKVKEIKSKYLHILHVLMNEFEVRFPGVDGLWRVEYQTENIEPILDVIRKQAEETKKKVTELYKDGHLPLSILSRIVGGEEISLSQYIRQIGMPIYTCHGNLGERETAIGNAAKARGMGVVLDTYTAWLCAEIDALDVLVKWFGSIFIPQSTIDQLDRMIAKESRSLGRQSMNVGWHDGQFVRTDITDDFIETQVAAIATIKSQLLAHCDVVPVLWPDDVDDNVVSICERLGKRVFDPIFLAKSQNAILLSDDLFFRHFGKLIGGENGVWLQAVLMAARRSGSIAAAEYGKFIKPLAWQNHRHLCIDANLLETLADSSDADDFKGFELVCSFLGGRDADMVSHCNVVGEFMERMWAKLKSDSKFERLASTALSATLLRERQGNEVLCAAFIWLRVGDGCKRLIADWLKANHLSKRDFGVAVDTWIASYQRWLWEGQFRRLGDISFSAMNARLAISPPVSA